MPQLPVDALGLWESRVAHRRVVLWRCCILRARVLRTGVLLRLHVPAAILRHPRVPSILRLRRLHVVPVLRLRSLHVPAVLRRGRITTVLLRRRVHTARTDHDVLLARGHHRHLLRVAATSATACFVTLIQLHLVLRLQAAAHPASRQWASDSVLQPKVGPCVVTMLLLE